MRYSKYNYDTDRSPLVILIEAWVLGYVSGEDFAHVMTTTATPADTAEADWLSEVTEDEVLTRMDNYCREHPSHLVAAAAGYTSLGLMQVHINILRNRLKSAPH
jgi:hypothetical protein